MGGAYPYVLWIIIFIVVPLGLILFYSLTTSEIDIRNMDLTLANFKRFLDPRYLDVLWRSIDLALKSTAICLVLGYPPMAMIIARENIRKRNVMILLFVIPMWMNFLLRTYAWLTLLGKNGFINYLITKLGFGPLNLIYNDGAVLMGMVYNFLPFMVLPIYSVLIKIEKSLIEAAEDLGASRWEVFFQRLYFH